MPEATAPSPHLQEFVHAVQSDELPHFVAFMQRITGFQEQVGFFRINLILDANMVIGDLLWLAKTRKNPTARTSLMELMDCQVVQAHAPYHLVREINTNLPEVAKKMHVPLGKLQALWKEYRKQIRFVAVGGPAKGKGMRDPKDAPYVFLQRKLNYPIATMDPHLAAMGAKVVQIQLFGSLRSYSRNAAIEYKLKVTGFGGALLVGRTLEGAFLLLRKLPKEVFWGAALLLLLAWANPNWRKKILEIAQGVFQGGSATLAAGIEVLGPAFAEHAQAKSKAAVHLAEAQAQLPVAKVTA